MASKWSPKEVLESNESSPPLLTSTAAAGGGTIKRHANPCTFQLSAPYLLPRNAKDKPAAEPESALWEDRYFFEDEVFKFDKRGRVKFGLIVDTPDYNSGDEDDDDMDGLTSGKVRVAWYPGPNEEVAYESFMGLADRTLMPGDVVRRTVNGRDTQRGYVREISMHADLKILGTKYVLTDVKTERLRPLSKWSCDSAVCLDSWVGSIKDFEDKAILYSSHGSRIQISSNDYFTLCDPNRDKKFNPQMFYPGNVVMGRFHTMENVKLLTPDRPIRMGKNGKPMADQYVVEDVQTESVWVNWQCKALSAEEDGKTAHLMQPESVVSGEDLKRLKSLNLYDSCMLQLNDRVYVRYLPSDRLVHRTDWWNEQSFKYGTLYAEQWQCEPLADSATNATNATVQSEKTRKRSSGHDSDRVSNKSKKFAAKTDKVISSNSKEKSLTIEESTESSVELRNSSTKNTDNCWVTDEDGDTHDEVDEAVGEGSARARETDDDVELDSEQTRTSPRQNNRANAQKKKQARKRAAITQERLPPMSYSPPKEGEEYIAEALLVYSSATVVWQDGTIEKDIPSTQLYPIHHLDNHEYFPGDFVLPGDVSKSSFREYGVVQSVDHYGRIVHVKWFEPYTTNDEPRPTYKGESEVSAYDLQDHTDFQYRPGTMVIRVANFVGEDEKSTAGQIVDNYIDGRIKVWWVDGHVSMCWPQDLFEVSQYNDNDWDRDSENSWETESEESEFGMDSRLMAALEDSQLLVHLQQTEEAIVRLEEMFTTFPRLQTLDKLEKLVSIYSCCFSIDNLMETDFFAPQSFRGILDPIRKRYLEIRNQELDVLNGGNTSGLEDSKSKSHYHAIISVHQDPNAKLEAPPINEYAPKVLFNLSSTPHRYKTAICKEMSKHRAPEEGNDKNSTTGSTTTTNETSSEVGDKVIPPAATEHVFCNKEEESCHWLTTADKHIETAMKRASRLKEQGLLVVTTQDDSGNYSHTENVDAGSESNASAGKDNDAIEEANEDATREANEDATKEADVGQNVVADVNESDVVAKDMELNRGDNISMSSVETDDEVDPGQICGGFCTILKQQLSNLISNLRDKYYKPEEEEEEYEDEFYDAMSKVSKEKTEPNTDDVEMADTEVVAETDEQTKEPTVSLTESDASSSIQADPECFKMLPIAPTSHKFHSTRIVPNNPKQYFRTIVREHEMLRACLPPGVWVRAFEDRLDLLSVMIEGPKSTPYEDGLFLFDFQLVRDYPKNPPVCHYISYCSDRLNPNLYEDGKVCVSLLGTWSGRDTEVWSANSTLLQVFVSIQGLILVNEPYYNEAGYEKQKDTYEGKTNARMYNEMAIIKLVQATMKMVQKPSEIYRSNILDHFRKRGYAMHNRIEGWVLLSKQFGNEALESEQQNPTEGSEEISSPSAPAFSLIPGSRGFCLSLEGLLATFKTILDELCAAPTAEEEDKDDDEGQEDPVEQTGEGPPAKNPTKND